MIHDLKYFQNLDNHPFSGELELDTPIKVKVKDEPHIRKFFDGTEGYEHITNFAIGKEYSVYKIEGYGDGADACFIDDNGKETSIMVDYLEEIA